VHAWRIAFDSKLKRNVHVLQSGTGHALLSSLVANAFQRLGVMGSIWAERHEWFPIHAAPSPLEFEQEHSKDADRTAYNQRHLAEAVRSREAVWGQSAGFYDLFVPISIRAQIAGVLVTGPFCLERPTAQAIVEQWRGLTGRAAHLSDPQFAAYLSSVLSMLTLPGDSSRQFQRLMGCLARLLGGEGAADVLANQARSLLEELKSVRLTDSMWETVQTMVDERTPQRWNTAGRGPELRQLGLSRQVNQVLVGLIVSRRTGGDAIEEALRRDAFQRKMVGLARRTTETLCGRVGDHGIVFMSSARGGASTRKQSMLDLAERASVIARRDHGLALHFGEAPAPEDRDLSRSYHDALRAVETALARGTRLESVDPDSSRQVRPLRELREELGRATGERAAVWGARFDRYLEAVAVQSGYRIDAARGHLEAGFERLSEPLTSSGALDLKSFRSLCETLDQRAIEARSLSDLLAAYRRAVSDLAEAVTKPVSARRDRSLRGALEHIRAHFTTPLRLAQVARLAGFAPSHFSKLFIERERMPFESYVRTLRIERATRLLFDTDLPVARVTELSGFRSQQYFATVFRQFAGMTPVRYRREHPMIRHRLRNKIERRNS